jgi:hypothetical protein
MWAISSYFHSNYRSQMGLGWVTPSTRLYISTTNQAPRYYHIYIQHEPTARHNLQEKKWLAPRCSANCLMAFFNLIFILDVETGPFLPFSFLSLPSLSIGH